MQTNEHAALGQQEDGTYRITGLVDAWAQREADGTVTRHESRITLDASVSVLRDFGGY